MTHLLQGNLTGLQHLGLPVTDIARSKAFYGQFGFKPVMETELASEEGAIQVAMLELNGFILELYQLVGVDLEAIRARGDGHIDHVALDVLDVQRAFETVRAAGIEPLEDAPVFLPFWERGIKYFYVLGPDGERVEFCERIK
jgi:lactoylglutathione lyase